MLPFNKWLSTLKQISEGIFNLFFRKDTVELLAAHRESICRTNICGYYDPLGTSDKAIHRGLPTCGACGCLLALKLRSPSAECGLAMLDQAPLWTSVTLL